MTASLFADLKVIDCASWIAGPAAATILADFGADVIKIEPPGAGDPWRAVTPIPGKPTDAYWQLTSRNKRSLALDLKQAGAPEVLRRLLTGADVFIENIKPGSLDKLGFGIEPVARSRYSTYPTRGTSETPSSGRARWPTSVVSG